MQRRRLGSTDWYDIAYRVYLFALVGLAVVVWVSEAVDGLIGDEVDTQDLLTRGPAIIGLMVAVAFALGVRSGADGGPISIEVADIRHVLLSPISQRSVMLRPIGQRLRSAAFSARRRRGSARAVDRHRGGGITSRLGCCVRSIRRNRRVHVRVDRCPESCTASASLARHPPRDDRRGLAGARGLGRVERFDGGTRTGGSWQPRRSPRAVGISQRGIDVIAIVIALAMAGAALLIGGRLRLEPLARRGELVSQLRFAATVQDLRTVVQLRRQLRAEALRTRQWGQRRHPTHPIAGPVTMSRHLTSPTTSTSSTKKKVGATSTSGSPDAAVARPSPAIVWRRGSRSLRRLPLARLVRIALLAAIAGVGGALAYDSSPLFGLLLLAGLFLVGLESLEPLSQEVDRPDLTEGFSIERGWIFAHHLVASAIFLVVVAMIGAGAATLVDPALAAGAFAIAIPMAWAGAMGPVVVTVLDAPTPISDTTLLGTPRDSETSFVPPEFAGFSTVFKALLPVLISAVGTLPVFVARFSQDATSVSRSLIALALFIAAAVLWVRRRDPWGVKIRNFFEEGRAAAK